MHRYAPNNSSLAPSTARLFADLRERNEYSTRVTQLLRAKRQRHVEQVIQAQRRHRLHQAG